MESGHNCHEESTNSSEEVEQENGEEIGVGRSYECVYCKRGFNTAQALGGHMNIHRKDRARNKPNNSSKHQEQQIYTGPRLYQQIMPPPPPPSSSGSHIFAPHDDHHNHNHQQQPHLMMSTYTTYFPARPLFENHQQQYSFHDSDHDHHRQPSNPLVPAGDWRVEFSRDLEINSRQAMNQKEDLDLELRLGYDS